MINPAPTPASGRGLGLSSVCATVAATVSGRRHAGGGGRRAFEVLVDQSQPRNIRVTVLAEEVVEVVGTLPRR